jgi:hypothetical protein
MSVASRAFTFSKIASAARWTITASAGFCCRNRVPPTWLFATARLFWFVRLSGSAAASSLAVVSNTRYSTSAASKSRLASRARPSES